MPDLRTPKDEPDIAFLRRLLISLVLGTLVCGGALGYSMERSVKPLESIVADKN
jgi:hypothetical protein